MIWYYTTPQPYTYPSNEEITDSFAKHFGTCIYEPVKEIQLYKTFQHMKEISLDRLSIIFTIKDLSVNYGDANDIDKDFCEQNNIFYRFEKRSGGTIVLFPGNIVIHDIYPSTTFLKQHAFVNDFASWLRGKGINATTDNNDLLIDNKKIIGTVSQSLPAPYDGWMFFGVTISINVDVDLINQICTKPMIKIPGALSDYDITTEEVMDWTLKWFDKHCNAE